MLIKTKFKQIVRLSLPLGMALFLIGAVVWALTVTAVTASVPFTANGANNCFLETTGDNTTDFSSMDASAVQTAVNAASPNDIIKIAGTCAGVNVINTISQTVYISKSLIVQGGYTNTNWMVSDPSTYTTTLDAQRQGRVAVISGTIDVTLDGLVFTGGGGITAVPNSNNDGAGIWSNSTLTLTHSSVISNLISTTAGDNGAGIYIVDGTLTIADSTIADNENQNQNGGGIHINASIVTILRTTIQNNRTKNISNNGGGMYIGGGSTVDINDSDIQSNYTLGTSANGGGMYISGDSTIDISDSDIQSNYTLGISANGGGLDMNGSNVVTITNSLIENNETFGLSAGGAIRNLGGDLTIINSVIQNNHAYGTAAAGGGINHSGGTTTIMSTRILSNSTEHGNGGGIYIGNGTINIKNSLIANNQSLDPSRPGGGLTFNQFGNNQKFVTLDNVTFSGNSSTSEGGAIWIPNGFLTMTHVTLSNNSAITSTGGISVGVNGVVNMANSLIANSTGDDCLSAGTFTDSGYNLVEDGNCITAGTSINGDPTLGALADNGGDTLTHALLLGSMAIDAGDPAYPVMADDYDQRGMGFVRVYNGRLDIGAYEKSPCFIYLPLILK